MTTKNTKPHRKDRPKRPDKRKPSEPVVHVVTVAANPARQSLLLKAAPNNQGVVWLGEKNTGIPLFPGNERALASNAEITITGQAGDQLYLAELNTEEEG